MRLRSLLLPLLLASTAALAQNVVGPVSPASLGNVNAVNPPIFRENLNLGVSVTSLDPNMGGVGTNGAAAGDVVRFAAVACWTNSASFCGGSQPANVINFTESGTLTTTVSATQGGQTITLGTTFCRSEMAGQPIYFPAPYGPLGAPLFAKIVGCVGSQPSATFSIDTPFSVNPNGASMAIAYGVQALNNGQGFLATDVGRRSIAVSEWTSSGTGGAQVLPITAVNSPTQIVVGTNTTTIDNGASFTFVYGTDDSIPLTNACLAAMATPLNSLRVVANHFAPWLGTPCYEVALRGPGSIDNAGDLFTPAGGSSPESRGWTVVPDDAPPAAAPPQILDAATNLPQFAADMPTPSVVHGGDSLETAQPNGLNSLGTYPGIVDSALARANLASFYAPTITYCSGVGSTFQNFDGFPNGTNVPCPSSSSTLWLPQIAAISPAPSLVTIGYTGNDGTALSLPSLADSFEQLQGLGGTFSKVPDLIYVTHHRGSRALAQTVSVTIGGTIVNGDSFTLNVIPPASTYVAAASLTIPITTGETTTQVAAATAAAVNANSTDQAIGERASSSGAVVTLYSPNPGMTYSRTNGSSITATLGAPSGATQLMENYEYAAGYICSFAIVEGKPCLDGEAEAAKQMWGFDPKGMQFTRRYDVPYDTNHITLPYKTSFNAPGFAAVFGSNASQSGTTFWNNFTGNSGVSDTRGPTINFQVGLNFDNRLWLFYNTSTHIISIEGDISAGLPGMALDGPSGRPPVTPSLKANIAVANSGAGGVGVITAKTTGGAAMAAFPWCVAGATVTIPGAGQVDSPSGGTSYTEPFIGTVAAGGCGGSPTNSQITLTTPVTTTFSTTPGASDCFNSNNLQTCFVLLGSPIITSSVSDQPSGNTNCAWTAGQFENFGVQWKDDRLRVWFCNPQSIVYSGKVVRPRADHNFDIQSGGKSPQLLVEGDSNGETTFQTARVVPVFPSLTDLQVAGPPSGNPIANNAYIGDCGGDGLSHNCDILGERIFKSLVDAQQWSVGLASGTATLAATNGGSTTIGQGIGFENLTPAATIASFTVTLPASFPPNGVLTIASDNTITSLSLTANAGQSLAASGIPTTLAGGAAAKLRLVGGVWYSVQ